MKVLNDEIITKGIIVQFQASKIPQCAHECNKDCHCKSFSFSELSKICILSNLTVKEAGLIKNEGVTSGEKVSDQKYFNKPYGIINCEPNTSLGKCMVFTKSQFCN